MTGFTTFAPLGWGGWLETDNRAISVQMNLTGTATGTELGKKEVYFHCFCQYQLSQAQTQQVSVRLLLPSRIFILKIILLHYLSLIKKK